MYRSVVVTSILHRLVGPTGLVIGIDHLPGLVTLSKRNMTNDGVPLGVRDGIGVEVILGDGRQGWEKYGMSIDLG